MKFPLSSSEMQNDLWKIIEDSSMIKKEKVELIYFESLSVKSLTWRQQLLHAARTKLYYGGQDAPIVETGVVAYDSFSTRNENRELITENNRLRSGIMAVAFQSMIDSGAPFFLAGGNKHLAPSVTFLPTAHQQQQLESPPITGQQQSGSTLHNGGR